MESYKDFDNEFTLEEDLNGGATVSVTINDEDGTRTWVKEFNSIQEARSVYAGLWQSYSDEELIEQGFNIV